MNTTVVSPTDPFEPDGGLPIIPGYRLTRLLGRGGMGSVYLGTDTVLNREVAVKTLLVADPQLAARFREEVTAVAAVRHPNVLQVYQAGEFDGRPFFAMEYVPGGTLAGRLDGKPMAAKEAATLLEPVARAVHFCHDQGILHRDLKPANILLAAGVPKVADFGLAKRLDSDAKLTKTGDVLGTPAYMAPEQASGIVTRLGPGVDVYALGAILYEMLTGRPPFQSPDPIQTLMMVLSMDPIPPRRLQPGVPRDLETICLRCLEKTPKRRYPSAEELAEDLKRFVDGRPIHARPIRTWEKGLKWARRRPAAAGLISLALLGVIALATGFLVIRGKNAELRDANVALDRSRAQTAEKLQLSLAAVNRMLLELADELANVPQAERARTNVLRDAESLCLKLIQSEAKDDFGRALIAQSRYQVAEVYRLQGRPDDAATQAKQACADFAALAKEFPARDDFRQQEMAAHNRLGQLYTTQGDLPAAEAEFRLALALGATLTNDPSIGPMLGRVRNNLALVLSRTNRLEEAEAEHRTLLAERIKAADLNATDESKIDLAATRTNLASLLVRTNRDALAMEQFAAAESALQSLAKPRPADRANLGKARLNIEATAGKTGAIGIQGRAAEAAIETFAALANDFRGTPEYRYLHAYARMRLGFWHGASGRVKEGSEQLKAARTILAALAAEFPDNAEYKKQVAACDALLAPAPKWPNPADSTPSRPAGA